MDDEFAKIATLKQRFELPTDGGDGDGVTVGIGDDAAVVDFGDRTTVISTDTQIEGVHFQGAFLTEHDIGMRALIAATCDVWAMGAAANAAVVALALPPPMTDARFESLIEGIAEAARLTGTRIVGGNLSGADVLSVTTTVFGSLDGPAVTRSGANVGDEVRVTGVLGAAALGLAALQSPSTREPHAEDFAQRWRRPPIHASFARALSGIATAAIDISDGLLQDLEHVCQASGVGARVEIDRLPLAPNHNDLARALECDGGQLALRGGEDYELLFTVPEGSDPIPGSTTIGSITDGSDVRVIDGKGQTLTIDRTGFRHFS